MKLGILPCQGACNVGMMTNKVALKFVDNERINLVCSLGLPLGIENIAKMAHSNDKFIALNGCPINCATKALESVQIKAEEEFILTNDFGIVKNKNYQDETNMDQVVAKIKESIDRYFEV